MKITFPHMGNTYIVAKTLFDELKTDYVIPPFNNKKALEIGTKYAPELACLPLKINIGNFMQAYEQGADSIFITGGCGPCRFGYYCEMHKEILSDIGCNMEVITFEWPDKGMRELLRRIKKVSGGLNLYKVAQALKEATIVSKQVDELEKLTFKIRPREIRKGSTDRIYKNFQRNVLKLKGAGEIKKMICETRNELFKIDIDSRFEPMKVGIVGEIYSTIDSFTNLTIEAKLGNMGIEVDRAVTVSGWIIEHILKNAVGLPQDLRYAEEADPYLGAMIGGHAQETIGNAIIYAKNGYDGVIQVYPLTCMPEIVAESILPAVERDFDIPVLTLVMDELTGEAGYLTRIEAFLDLLDRRRERKQIERSGLLSGN